MILAKARALPDLMQNPGDAVGSLALVEEFRNFLQDKEAFAHVRHSGFTGMGVVRMSYSSGSVALAHEAQLQLIRDRLSRRMATHKGIRVRSIPSGLRPVHLPHGLSAAGFSGRSGRRGSAWPAARQLSMETDFLRLWAAVDLGLRGILDHSALHLD